MELPTSSRELAGKVAVTVLTAAAIVVVLAALWFGRSLALLAFAGLLLAILLRAVTNFLKRVSGLPDSLALAVTVLLFVGGAAGALVLLAPNIEAQAQSLWKQLPDTLDQARSQLSHHTWGQRLLAITPSANGILSRGSQLTRRSAEAIFGVLGIVGDGVVIAFIGLYFAINPRRYTSGAIALFPAPWNPPSPRPSRQPHTICAAGWLGRFA